MSNFSSSDPSARISASELNSQIEDLSQYRITFSAKEVQDMLNAQGSVGLRAFLVERLANIAIIASGVDSAGDAVSDFYFASGNGRILRLNANRAISTVAISRLNAFWGKDTVEEALAKSGGTGIVFSPGKVTLSNPDGSESQHETISMSPAPSTGTIALRSGSDDDDDEHMMSMSPCPPSCPGDPDN